jgi:hypothetical protein
VNLAGGASKPFPVYNSYNLLCPCWLSKIFRRLALRIKRGNTISYCLFHHTAESIHFLHASLTWTSRYPKKLRVSPVLCKHYTVMRTLQLTSFLVKTKMEAWSRGVMSVVLIE